eukprot:282781-Alexandrium_andersonii.AAC.1
MPRKARLSPRVGATTRSARLWRPAPARLAPSPAPRRPRFPARDRAELPSPWQGAADRSLQVSAPGAGGALRSAAPPVPGS